MNKHVRPHQDASQPLAPFDDEGLVALLLQSLRISDRGVICEIECNGEPVDRGGLRWYDVSAWLSRDEHCQEHLDQALEVMAYAQRRNLIVRHPFDRHLVRVAVAGDGLAFSRAFAAASRERAA